MLAKRIIPCLDIKNGRTVKGVRFQNLVDKGDPVDLAKRYADEGADELVLLDISATLEERSPFVEIVNKVAAVLNIPFAVGGGVRKIKDAKALLDAGADKIAINSAAVQDPDIITRLAEQCGSQAIVVSIDVSKIDGRWQVYTRSATQKVSLDALEWCKQVKELGAGEILLTSIDSDGVRDGFDCELVKAVTTTVNIPVIASGGAGSIQDFINVFQKGEADAALAAGVFHDRLITVRDVKQQMLNSNIEVRL